MIIQYIIYVPIVIGRTLIEKLLSSTKVLIKSENINWDTIYKLLSEFKWEILLTLTLSTIFNFFLFWLIKKNFKEIRENLLSSIGHPSLQLDKNDYLLPVSSSIFLTLITYRNVLSKFTTKRVY